MNYKSLLIWDSKVKSQHPNLSICACIINNVKNTEHPPILEDIKQTVIKKIHANYTLENIKDESTTRRYRDFYWRLGIDPTKIRPAGEALVRRILANKPFPRISPAVDAYNLASVETLVALSGYDYSKILFPLTVRLASVKDVFQGIGMDKTENLQGNEIVVCDREKIICVYPYRDSELSKIDPQTSKILILGYSVPGLDLDTITRAVQKACENIKLVCGGEIEYIETL
ncbi:MAG: phenylalanine--tRNA ligase beta subunit-related protein [Candidatus Odinarchaeota archaeon]